MARRRILRPEEEEIWRLVAGTVTPRHPQAIVFPKSSEAVPLIETKAATYTETPRIAPFKMGQKAPAPPWQLQNSAKPSLQMDAKTHGKMTRGKLAPEARIDLHGMTLAEAHAELISFILSAQSAGLRLVLVITGKGKRGQDDGAMPPRIGVLRQQVPHWLRLAPLGPAVLQVTEAHLKHGGAGACYVYLRRR